MKRKLLSVWIAGLMMVVAAGPVGAQEGNKDLLGAVPGEAWAALVIRNVGDFDRKMMQFNQQLNVPAVSALAMAKGAMGITSGLDESGSVAVVLMPPANVMQAMESIAVLVPTQDYAALTGGLQPEDVGEGVTKVMVVGEQAFVAPRGAFALVSPNPQAIKTITASQTALKGSWTSHQLERFGADDVTLWLNVKAILADPMISGMMQMLAPMAGPAFNVEQLKAFETFTISLRLEKTGLHMGVYQGIDKASPQGKAISSGKPTSKSLLTGLPKDNFVLALGAEMSEAEAAFSAEQVTAALSNPMLTATMDEEQVRKLTAFMTNTTKDLRGFALSFSGLPSGPDGVVGMTKVVTVAGGAANKCTQLSEVLALLPAMIPVPEAQQLFAAMNYAVGAEDIGGVSVNHLILSVDQLPDATPEKIAQVKKLFGQEGVLFRLAALDDNHIVATLGGGAERFGKVLEVAKSGNAPLSEDQGIQNVAGLLRKERSVEAYLALDHLASAAEEIAKIFDEQIPFRFTEVNAPVGMVAGIVGPGESQMDIAVPMELVVAVKDVAMSMSGGHAPPPQEPADPAAPDSQ